MLKTRAIKIIQVIDFSQTGELIEDYHKTPVKQI